MKNKNLPSLKIIVTMLAACMILPIASCNKEKWPNRVDIDQINYDDSTNYEQIFKEDIKKQKERDNRYKKDEF